MTFTIKTSKTVAKFLSQTLTVSCALCVFNAWHVRIQKCSWNRDNKENLCKQFLLCKFRYFSNIDISWLSAKYLKRLCSVMVEALLCTKLRRWTGAIYDQRVAPAVRTVLQVIDQALNKAVWVPLFWWENRKTWLLEEYPSSIFHLRSWIQVWLTV